jgi:Mrp family chromosome partitioning ATPase
VLLLVTTPSGAARHVVSKSARLVEELGVPRVGVVVNMSTYRCPCCGCEAPLFEGDSGAAAASFDRGRVWAEIPFDPQLGAATDAGRPSAAPDAASPAAQEIVLLAERIERECER